MFEVRNIAFAYRSRSVLRDVSFVVSPGETVCLVGDNGAGKTTLLRVLSTRMSPGAGQVLIDGQDALARPLRYRHQLGYMQEHPALYDDMTVRAYLTYRAQLKGEPEKRIRRRVGEAAEICQISDDLGTLIGFLSYGLKKRVALADAMLLRPRVLLLDDFLAGLDSSMRAAASGVLASVAAFSSVIVTGHELEDLAHLATRFLVLRNGVIGSSIPATGIPAADLVRRVRGALRGGTP
ncbi:MAG: ABC transporter ATP-binding protein [Kiritimatiellia bacterium]